MQPESVVLTLLASTHWEATFVSVSMDSAKLIMAVEVRRLKLFLYCFNFLETFSVNLGIPVTGTYDISQS